jgi:hypothetical protein
MKGGGRRLKKKNTPFDEIEWFKCDECEYKAKQNRIFKNPFVYSTHLLGKCNCRRNKEKSCRSGKRVPWRSIC